MNTRSKISDVFPILLFLVFTLSALGIVLASVQIYQKILVQAEDSYDTRTASAYLTEKFRNHDENGNIKIDKYMGLDAVLIEESVKEIPYVTYIYAYDGYLRELYIEKDKLSQCNEESGNKIIEMKNFDAEMIKDNLALVKLTDIKDKSIETYLSIHSKAGGGDEL